jgi:hypothetical protein
LADDAFQMFSHDSKRMLTTSPNTKSAKVWSVKDAVLEVSILGHEGEVTSANFSSDGTLIVTGSRDRTARIWEAASGKLKTSLTGHAGEVTIAAFDRDGKRVVTGSQDKTVKVWDAASGKLIVSLEGHHNGVRGAAFSPDGDRIVTVDENRRARIWDALSGKLLALPQDYVDKAIFSPDGMRILTNPDRPGTRVREAHLEMRSATRIARLVRCIAPWQLQHGNLVPSLPDPAPCLSADAPPTPSVVSNDALRRRALLIGTDEYAELDSVRSGSASVRAVSRALVDIAGYSRSDIRMLWGTSATKGEIMRQIGAVLSDSQNEPLDHFLLMFSGRCLPHELNRPGGVTEYREFFVPFDTTLKHSGWGEFSYATNVVETAWLGEQLSAIRAKSIVVIVDGCRFDSSLIPVSGDRLITYLSAPSLEDFDRTLCLGNSILEGIKMARERVYSSEVKTLSVSALYASIVEYCSQADLDGSDYFAVTSAPFISIAGGKMQDAQTAVGR